MSAEEDTGNPKAEKIRLLYLERFLEWLIDLLSQLPTRRFTRVLLEDSALLVKVQHSGLVKQQQGQLFSQLVDLLAFYMSAPPPLPSPPLPLGTSPPFHVLFGRGVGSASAAAA